MVFFMKTEVILGQNKYSFYLGCSGDNSPDRNEFTDAVSLDLANWSRLDVRRGLEVDLVTAHQLLREVVGSRTGNKQKNYISF
jgi:hypothetical protein